MTAKHSAPTGADALTARVKSVVANVQAYIARAKAAVAYVRKLIVHVAMVASTLLAMNLLPEPVATYVTIGLGVLTSVGLYKAANERSANQDPEPRT